MKDERSGKNNIVNGGFLLLVSITISLQFYLPFGKLCFFAGLFLFFLWAAIAVKAVKEELLFKLMCEKICLVALVFILFQIVAV
jgi:hypothetical protein